MELVMNPVFASVAGPQILAQDEGANANP